MLKWEKTYSFLTGGGNKMDLTNPDIYSLAERVKIFCDPDAERRRVIYFKDSEMLEKLEWMARERCVSLSCLVSDLCKEFVEGK